MSISWPKCLPSIACAGILMALPTVVGTGCGKSGDQAEAQDPPSADAQRNVATQAELPLQQRFENALTTNAVSPEAAALFGELIQEWVREGRVADARALFDEHAQQDPILAGQGFETLVGYYRATNAWDELVAWTDALVETPPSPELQSYAFTVKLDALTRTDNVDEAQRLLIEGLNGGNEYSHAAVGIVARHIHGTGDAQALADWTKQLADSKAPDSLRGRALGWHVGALVDLTLYDDVIALVPECLTLMGEDGCRSMLGNVTRMLSSGENVAAARAILQAFESVGGEGSALRSYAQTELLKLLIREKEWGSAEAYYQEIAKSLQNRDHQMALRELGRRAASAGQWDLVERLTASTLETFAQDVALITAIAPYWIDAALNSAAKPQVVERLRRLQSLGLPNAALLQNLSKSIYASMDLSQSAALEPLIAFANELSERLESEDEQNNLTTLMFDGAFILEQYDRVLELLEKGIGTRDEAWHAMAINKVKAHAALKAGNVEEAAKRFRDFMAYVESTWERPETDPSTGIQHTKEMALGFNARRIGDILREAGKVTHAQDAYREARDFYTKALASLKADSKEAGLVRQALDELNAFLAPPAAE